MLRRFFGRRDRPRRVLVLGLDCAAPELVFDRYHDDLPVLRSLMERGTWGVLKSSIPCITVPAWSSMFSSRDPGELGIYGFRNRADTTYDGLFTADSRRVQLPRLWDVLDAAGKQSLVMNVPQTYPVQPLTNGHLVAGFLTPNTGAQFAYPAIMKQEVLTVAPDYAFDVRDFRQVERGQLLAQIQQLTDTQYRVFEHFLREKAWDAAIHVNIGLDRVHHAFWRYHDKQHRLHEPDSPFKYAIRDYYKQIDSWLGRLIDAAGDDTAVLIVSDHGAKRMDGAIAINEWLWREGWLALRQEPQRVTSFSHEMVDWSRTKAWSTGGYYGRIFLNVEGREPQGVIPQAQYETVRDELSAALEAIPGDSGQPLHTRVFRPQQIYRHVRNIAPDLMVYFGDLHWRAVGSIGYGQHYTLENDTGPDDANHAEDGLFILHQPGQAGAGDVAARQLMDVAPTVLNLLNVDVPATMQGQSLIATIQK
jgi:predicted AlkP superfamily phosphohydrolase/phosphomutase